MSIDKKFLTRIAKGLQWVKKEEGDIVQQKPCDTMSTINEMTSKKLRASQQPIKKTGRATQRRSQKSTQLGLSKGWKRATFIIKEDYFELLKTIAYWDGVPLKDIINQAVNDYLVRKDLKEYLKHRRKHK